MSSRAKQLLKEGYAGFQATVITRIGRYTGQGKHIRRYQTATQLYRKERERSNFMYGMDLFAMKTSILFIVVG